MNLNRLKVRTRLAIGFSLILALLAISITIGLRSLATLSASTDNIVTETYAEVLKAEELRNLNNAIAEALHNAVLVKTEEQAIKALDHVVATRKTATEVLASLDRLIDDPQARTLYDSMTAARGPFGDAVAQFITLRREGQRDAAIDFMFTTLRDRQLAYIHAIEALIQHETGLMEAARVNAAQTYRDARNTSLELGALSFLLGIASAAVIARQLMRELGGEPADVVSIAAKIAAGDLTVPIATRAGDQTSLLFAVQSMRDSLADIVGRVRSGADAIQTAATEIAGGSMDLSSRTEQQASALEETASSMEELTATVQHNTESARQADVVARSASAIAARGSVAVSDVVTTMAGIHASAEKIGDIIGVIDSIAFQTNILALNAAVEAARAGEHGRGFAVVASEVRTLSHRSAAAAKEIKLLIDESSGKVAAGTGHVAQAGKTMTEILASVERLTGLMADISAASQEQGMGIGQANRAIAEMDIVTQQNAALVEEAAAAAEAQQEQARQLVRLVGTFRLAHGPASAGARPHAGHSKASLLPGHPQLRAAG